MDRIEANRAHAQVRKITKRAYVYSIEKGIVNPNEKIYHTTFNHKVDVKNVSISVDYVPENIKIFCLMEIEQADGLGARYKKIEIKPGDNVMPSIGADKGETMSFVFSTFEEVDNFELHNVVISYTLEQ